MCDCLQQRDDKIVGKIGPETVTLFSKCPAPLYRGKDILEHTIPVGFDRMSSDSVQSSSSDTTCDSAKISSTDTTDSFSSESRTVDYRLEISSMITIICRDYLLQTNYVDNCSINLFIPRKIIILAKKRALNYRSVSRPTKSRRSLKRYRISNTPWL